MSEVQTPEATAGTDDDELKDHTPITMVDKSNDVETHLALKIPEEGIDDGGGGGGESKDNSSSCSSDGSKDSSVTVGDVSIKTSGGKAALVAYQNIKKRLVELTVELEDKTRKSELLTEAINRERSSAAVQIRKRSLELAAEAEEREAKQKAELQALLDKGDALLQQKKELTARCRASAEVLRRAEAATKAAIEEAEAASKAEFEEARQTWEAGKDARRKRFLAQKAADARAQTIKGLEPEIETIMTKVSFTRYADP